MSRYQSYKDQSYKEKRSKGEKVVFRKRVFGLLYEDFFLEKNEVTLSVGLVLIYYRQLNEVGLLGLVGVLVLALDLFGGLAGRSLGHELQASQ